MSHRAPHVRAAITLKWEIREQMLGWCELRIKVHVDLADRKSLNSLDLTVKAHSQCRNLKVMHFYKVVLG